MSLLSLSLLSLLLLASEENVTASIFDVFASTISLETFSLFFFIVLFFITCDNGRVNHSQILINVSQEFAIEIAHLKAKNLSPQTLYPRVKVSAEDSVKLLKRHKQSCIIFKASAT